MALTQVASGLIASVAGSTITGSQSIPKGTLPTGSVLQVVQGTYSTSTTTTSTSYVDTGLTASITPSSSNSKILVIISQNGLDVTATNAGIGLNLVRGVTNLSDFAVYANYSTTGIRMAWSFNYLDSPSTTSSTTYKTQFKKMGGTGSIVVQDSSSVSAITLMEIAA